MSDFRTIPLTRGLEAVVDAADYEALSAFKWHASDRRANGSAYARAKINNKLVYMHRWLLAAPVGAEVDHINRDKLDNRRANLRVCAPEENRRNVGLTCANTVGFKGVRWVRTGRKWGASIYLDKKHVFLGVYATKEEAARAYDGAAREFWGEFAYLNFPEAA